MRLTSRVVVTNALNKGKTGTIMDFVGGSKNILVGFDDGTNGKFEKEELIEIDDISFEGFSEGTKVYVSDFNRVGKIERIAEGQYIVRWEDGSTAAVALNEEKDFAAV